MRSLTDSPTPPDADLPADPGLLHEGLGRLDEEVGPQVPGVRLARPDRSSAPSSRRVAGADDDLTSPASWCGMSAFEGPLDLLAEVVRQGEVGSGLPRDDRRSGCPEGSPRLVTPMVRADQRENRVHPPEAARVRFPLASFDLGVVDRPRPVTDEAAADVRCRFERRPRHLLDGEAPHLDEPGEPHRVMPSRHRSPEADDRAQGAQRHREGRDARHCSSRSIPARAVRARVSDSAFALGPPLVAGTGQIRYPRRSRRSPTG